MFLWYQNLPHLKSLDTYNATYIPKDHFEDDLT